MPLLTPPRSSAGVDDVDPGEPFRVERSQGDRAARHWGRLLGVVASAVLVLGGVTESFAWVAHLPQLLRIHVDLSPMMFNAALAFVIAGFALGASLRGPSAGTSVAGAALTILGGASLLEHLTGASLGIDQLFLHDYLTAPGGHPGRMAPNTAACFLVFGLALLLWTRFRVWQQQLLIGTSMIVAGVAVTALLGYLLDISSAYSWGRFSAMSLPSAGAMLVLAAGVLAPAILNRKDADSPLSQWVALPAGVAVFAVLAGIWQAVVEVSGGGGALSFRAATLAMTLFAVFSALALALTVWHGQRSNSRRHDLAVLARQLRSEAESRAAAEERAREGERILADILDALPVGVSILHADGRPHLSNRMADGMLGRNLSSSSSVDGLPEDFQAYREGTNQLYPVDRLPIVRALAGELSHIEDLVVRPPGAREIPLEVWGAPVLDDDGGVQFAVAAFIDITRRRAAQREVSEKATLLDLADDAILIRDCNRRITYWNKAAETRYGFSKREAIGRSSFDLLDAQLPIPLEQVEEELRLNGHWQGDLVHHDKTGQRIYVHARWVARFASDGSIASVMSTNSDITARKELELILRQRWEQVQELNRELERSNEDLEQFAYAASHDLSEPLRAISGPVSLIARRYQGKLDPDTDRFIEFAVDGCERMQALINDLLTFSRVGRLEGRRSTLDLNALVSDVLEGLQASIDASDAAVSVGDLPAVHGEASQLRQVFQNLIGNALKFRRPDVPPVASVRCAQVDGFWRFTVSDNGIGIDPKYRDRVFGMFKRLHTRDAYPGTGIGLALCKKIIERHGGQIGIEDAELPGTSFWFTLPTGKGSES